MGGRAPPQLVVEHEEVPFRIGDNGTDAFMHGSTPMPNLFQHSLRNDNVLQGGIIEEINLLQDHVRIKDEIVPRLRPCQCEVLLPAFLAEHRAAVDVIAKVVLAHYLHHVPLPRLADEAPLPQHYARTPNTINSNRM